MKTQIIPRRCSPRPGLHYSLPLPTHLLCATALPPNTPPLSPLYPSTPLSPPSLSPSPPSLTPSSPNARSCQAVSGARCGGEIATRMHSQMHEYTYTKHMVLTQARLQGLCYLCCTHIHTHAHTQSGGRPPQLCFALLRLAAWLKLSSGYPGCWDWATFSDTHTHWETHTQGTHDHHACKHKDKNVDLASISRNTHTHTHTHTHTNTLTEQQRTDSLVHSSWFVHWQTALSINNTTAGDNHNHVQLHLTHTD